MFPQPQLYMSAHAPPFTPPMNFNGPSGPAGDWDPSFPFAGSVNGWLPMASSQIHPDWCDVAPSTCTSHPTTRPSNWLRPAKPSASVKIVDPNNILPEAPSKSSLSDWKKAESVAGAKHPTDEADLLNNFYAGIFFQPSPSASSRASNKTTSDGHDEQTGFSPKSSAPTSPGRSKAPLDRYVSGSGVGPSIC
jgi:hypothetical protein